MSTPDQKKKNMISLRTLDGQVFVLEEHLAMESTTIKNFFDDFSKDTVMSLTNVKSRDLAKIMKFCTKVRELETKFEAKYGTRGSKTDGLILQNFLAEFNKDLSPKNMVYLLSVVADLDIKILIEILTQCIADSIENKSVDYIRDLFGLQSSFDPEMEAQFRYYHAWAFVGLEE